MLGRHLCSACTTVCTRCLIFCPRAPCWYTATIILVLQEAAGLGGADVLWPRLLPRCNADVRIKEEVPTRVAVQLRKVLLALPRAPLHVVLRDLVRSAQTKIFGVPVDVVFPTREGRPGHGIDDEALQKLLFSQCAENSAFHAVELVADELRSHPSNSSWRSCQCSPASAASNIDECEYSDNPRQHGNGAPCRHGADASPFTPLAPTG